MFYRVNVRLVCIPSILNPLRIIQFQFEFSTYLEESPRVFVSIIDANGSATESDIKANSEVGWLEWHLASVLLEDHLSLQEGSLHCSTVDFLWFGDQNRAILEEVVNC